MSKSPFFSATIAQGVNQDQNLIVGKSITIDIRSVVMFTDAGSERTFLSLQNGASVTIKVAYENFKEIQYKFFTMK